MPSDPENRLNEVGGVGCEGGVANMCCFTRRPNYATEVFFKADFNFMTASFVAFLPGLASFDAGALVIPFFLGTCDNIGFRSFTRTPRTDVRKKPLITPRPCHVE